jgi:Skp family chaperone for outer membrane proteins
VIDIGYIFKNHVRFKQMMDSLKQEVQQAEARIRAENEAIRQLTQQLEQERPGTPNYKQLEETIAKRRADLQVQTSLQRKEFLLREAKLHYAVYQEIEQVVRYYATQNNIAVVLRFNGEPADPDDPESILREINKPVVYYAQSLDLTPVVLEALNRSAAQTATPRQPTAPAGRTGLPNPY